MIRARSILLATSLASLVVLSPRIARAQDSSPTPTPDMPPVSRPAQPAPSAANTAQDASSRKSAGQGVAVLAIGQATDAAWALGQKVYANVSLRPASLDEPHARVLAGESPAPDAPKELRDLADTRAAIHGDDAPSRQLLASVCAQLGVRGVVTVAATESGPRARLFLADSNTFDAATWSPVADEQGSLTWDAAVRSLERTLSPKIALPAPIVAPPKTKEKTEESKPFYTSAWFWGALGGAAFAGGAIYFLTRDSGPGSIHLQMQVPR